MLATKITSGLFVLIYLYFRHYSCSYPTVTWQNKQINETCSNCSTYKLINDSRAYEDDSFVFCFQTDFQSSGGDVRTSMCVTQVIFVISLLPNT